MKSELCTAYSSIEIQQATKKREMQRGLFYDTVYDAVRSARGKIIKG